MQHLAEVVCKNLRIISVTTAKLNVQAYLVSNFSMLLDFSVARFVKFVAVKHRKDSRKNILRIFCLTEFVCHKLKLLLNVYEA